MFSGAREAKRHAMGGDRSEREIRRSRHGRTLDTPSSASSSSSSSSFSSSATRHVEDTMPRGAANASGMCGGKTALSVRKRIQQDRSRVCVYCRDFRETFGDSSNRPLNNYPRCASASTARATRRIIHHASVLLKREGINAHSCRLEFTPAPERNSRLPILPPDLQMAV